MGDLLSIVGLGTWNWTSESLNSSSRSHTGAIASNESFSGWLSWKGCRPLQAGRRAPGSAADPLVLPAAGTLTMVKTNAMRAVTTSSMSPME